MFTKKITFCACAISLLGACASTNGVSPIGQCNPGAPRALIDLPDDYAGDGIARQVEALGLDEEQKRAIDARWLDGARVEAEAIIPPRVQYPRNAWNRNLQGVCNVFFAVGVDGKAVAAEAFCTDTVFVASAVKAVNEAQYKPVTVDGVTKVRFAVFQPLIYCLN